VTCPAPTNDDWEQSRGVSETLTTLRGGLTTLRSGPERRAAARATKTSWEDADARVRALAPAFSAGTASRGEGAPSRASLARAVSDKSDRMSVGQQPQHAAGASG
jgi:hypothetical protein